MSQTRKRGKLPVQQRTFQNTVGVLQPLIGKVPSIMSKERMSLLGFKKKYFCIFLDGVTHINPLYYWKSMAPQHNCHHMAASYIKLQENL